MLSHTVPHFLNNERVQYMCRDILSQDLLSELEDIVAYQTREKGRTCLLVGMHLCGLLSTRAIDFFHAIADIKALVLSPCCLPTKVSQVKIGYKKEKPEVGEDPALFHYFKWVDYLKDHIDEKLSDVQMYRDTNMHTEKNAIIISVRK